MSDDVTPRAGGPDQPLQRDRQRLRRGGRAGGFRRWLADLPARVLAVSGEILGELLLAALAAVISVLVYGEVRWLFVAAVWFGVNAVLVVIALAVWVGHRRRR